MEIEKIVMKSKIEDVTYRVTAIMGRGDQYKIVSILTDPKIPIHYKLIDMMQDTYGSIRDIKRRFKSTQQKLKKQQ